VRCFLTSIENFDAKNSLICLIWTRFEQVVAFRNCSLGVDKVRTWVWSLQMRGMDAGGGGGKI
jgi:hypothetical protein